MPKLKAPDTITASTTAQRVVLPARNTWYTITNSAAGSAYYIADPAVNEGDVAATLTGTAAALRTLGMSDVKSKGQVSFFADAPWIDIVLPTGGVSGSVDITAGNQIGAANVEANLGNVGLLDTGETEIDPAIDPLNGITLLHADFLNAAVANGAFYDIAPDPAAATKVKIVELSITQTVQGLTEIRDTSNAGNLLAQWYFPAYGGILLPLRDRPHLVAETANEPVGLVNETGEACGYAGHVIYYLEA